MPPEEKAVGKYLELMANLRKSVRIKCLPALAFSIARPLSTNKATKPPSKNWPWGFQKRYPVLRLRRVTWTRLESCYVCDGGVICAQIGVDRQVLKMWDHARYLH
jgi:hypothetical protein